MKYQYWDRVELHCGVTGQIIVSTNADQYYTIRYTDLHGVIHTQTVHENEIKIKIH